MTPPASPSTALKPVGQPAERTRATFVIPCLNEAATLGALLEECNAVFGADAACDWDVIVADNGSTDGSIDIAREHGAEVVHVAVRGYGAALNAGILNATTDYVVYGDADGTYRPVDAVKLTELARRERADLVLGSRIKGEILPGAMPWSHRHLGTPVLSGLIRVLYGMPITDCNSGIRCVRRDSYVRWKLRSPGMEFASSLLIRAANSQARILELPVTLRPNPPGRVPHLKRWRDGMRHLLVVLAGAPWLFWRAGLTLLTLSLASAIPCLQGPFMVGRFNVFGPHTLALSTIVGFYGALCFSVALLAYSNSPTRKDQPRLSEYLVKLPEDTLFWSLVGFAGTFVIGAAYLLWRWSQSDFMVLNYVKWALFIVYLTVIPVTLVMGIFQAHLGKRFQS